MRRLLLSFTILLVCLTCSADVTPVEPARPLITGIAAVIIRVSNRESSRDFYSKSLGLGVNSADCGAPESPCFALSEAQFVAIEHGDVKSSANLIAEVAFATNNVPGLQQYLVSHGLHPSEVSISGSGRQLIVMNDPEGHRIAFVESRPREISSAPFQVSARLIHAGFVVRDRAAEDKFYKDILGFHVYWHGGMRDGEDNWVDMQVPDGTDWIEYMLGISPDASHKTLGVMNHIALGVPDIHAAQQQLIKNGWKANEEPKIGRDGKWQLNLYDPDETRVELMEFKPTKEPCCSPYTGPHPEPPQ
jgi:catechol 2,3-dioxygenase-like lactoylglutathione lyase family enzyme